MGPTDNAHAHHRPNPPLLGQLKMLSTEALLWIPLIEYI